MALRNALNELNASSVVTTIAAEFAALSPSVQMCITHELSDTALATRLVENEQFVMQLVEFLDARFDRLPASDSGADSDFESRPVGDRVSGGEQAVIFRMISAHAGSRPLNKRMEQFLRRFVAAAGRPPSNNRMFWPASHAAMILSRHGTDAAFTSVLSDAVRNEISVNRRIFDVRSRTWISPADRPHSIV